MTSNKEIKDWYNTYTKRQKKTGVNLRHYTVIDNAVKAGLKRNHTVLEVGCGIGTLTGLLAKYLRSGKLLATDISDESIEMAKRDLKKYSNVDFMVSDMKKFDLAETFDFIILPDVLEHIPMDQHKVLFQNLSAALKNKGKLLINIPHPKYTAYLHANEPEKLQIIDQSVPADFILTNAYKTDLTLVHYQSYSIFNSSPDYASILFEKNNPLVYSDRSRWEVILSKLKLRFKY